MKSFWEFIVTVVTFCTAIDRDGSFEYNPSQVQGLPPVPSVECHSWQGLAEHFAVFLKVNFEVRGT
jgi:hypothetical protein